MNYPNGSINIFEYDIFGNGAKTYFKDNENAPKVLISEYELYDNFNSGVISESINYRGSQEALSDNYTSDYNISDGGKTLRTFKTYYNKKADGTTDTSIFDKTIMVYDYKNQLVKTIMPDNTITKTNYNKNGTVASAQSGNKTTYMFYDNLNRVTDKWEPFEIVNSTHMYKYTKTIYDNDSNIVSEITKKNTVTLPATLASVTLPQTLAVNDYQVKNYTYYNNGKKNIESDNEGHKTKYTYDCDGNIKGEYVFLTENPTSTQYQTIGIPEAGEALVTTFTYTNKRAEKPDSKTLFIKANEISGNLPTNNNIIQLKYNFTYDKAGNLKTETTPAYTAADGTAYPSVTTTNGYDSKNRLTSVTMPDNYADSLNSDNYGDITEITEYNWEDKVISKTDGNGNITEYEYNPAGWFVKEKHTLGTYEVITAYDYDLAGRKIIEVSPQNYVADVPLNTLDRTEFTYNYLGKVITQTEVYRPYNINTNSFETDFVTRVSKALKYDSDGNIIKELDGLGYASGIGDTVSEKIETGYGKISAYNLAGNLISELDAESKAKNLQYTKQFTYDTLGRITSEKDADNNLISYVYNDQSRELRKIRNVSTEEYDKIIEYQKFDLVGNAIETATHTQKGETIKEGAKTTCKYGLFNTIIEQKTPSDDTIDENTIIYQYDVFGNLAHKSDSFGQIELYTYNNRGLEISHTVKKGADSSDSSTTYAKYDKNGNKKIFTDGNNISTYYSYDSLNRLTDENLNNKNTHWTYDKNGNNLTTTNWLSNTSEFIYDKLNRLVEKKDSTGQIIEKLEYNDNNTQVCSYTPYFNGSQYVFVKTSYFYDKNNRLTETTDPLNHTVKQTYDKTGNIKTITDGKNNIKTYYYDSLSRLTKVISPNEETVSFTYDKDNNKTSQSMGGKTRRYEYNVTNQIKKLTDPMGKEESYKYYPNGLLQEKLDKNKITTNYYYNYSGLLINENAGNEIVSKVYDQNGNELYSNTQTDSIGRTFDTQNRVDTKTQTGYGTIFYQYDVTSGLSNGEVAEISTHPNGTVVKKVYNNVGRLSNVYYNNNLEVSYNYYADGKAKSMVYANGITTDYSYFETGQLKEVIISRDDETLYNFTYLYDAAGNLIYKNEIKEQSFGYNNLNMLIWEKDGKETDLNGYTNMYEYDSNYNRIKQHASDFSLFDAQVDTNYSYNKRNALITLNNGSQNTFDYNAEGYRIKKNSLNYAYEYDKPVAEYDSTGVKAFNLYGTNLVCRIVGNEKLYYIYNSHGDVIAVTNSDGNIVSTYEYDAWGNIVNQTGNIDNPFLYCGYVFDKESGLYYLNARYYDPVIGRFINEDTYLGDPTDPLSLNLYTYTKNNPLKYDDPTGHWAHIAGGAVLGGFMDMGINAIYDYVDDGEVNRGWRSYTASFARGAVTGGMYAAIGPSATATEMFVAQFLVGATGNMVYNTINNGAINYDEALQAGAFSSILYGATSKLTGTLYSQEDIEWQANVREYEMQKEIDRAKLDANYEEISRKYDAQLEKDRLEFIEMADRIEAQKQADLLAETQQKAADAAKEKAKQEAIAEAQRKQNEITKQKIAEENAKQSKIAKALSEGKAYNYATDEIIEPDVVKETINAQQAIAKNKLNGNSNNKPNQVHHFATNKNSTYTKEFNKISNKYGLDLDGKWNKASMPHQGRHPNAYHDYLLGEMRDIDKMAKGNSDVFLSEFDKIKNFIFDNPDILTKNYWK